MTTLLLLTGNLTSKAGDNSSDEHTVTISIPEVALLDLEGTTAITLTPTAPKEAGEGFDFSSATNNNVWVNYSSVVARKKHRNVTVEISSGKVPAGLALTVVASKDAGNGKGAVGKPAGTVTLSSVAQKIIYGVGSCFTGAGVKSGHNLTYALSLTSESQYANLVNADTDITITYTLTDDN